MPNNSKLIGTDNIKKKITAWQVSMREKGQKRPQTILSQHKSLSESSKLNFITTKAC
jgi:hypothetical protein